MVGRVAAEDSAVPGVHPADLPSDAKLTQTAGDDSSGGVPPAQGDPGRAGGGGSGAGSPGMPAQPAERRLTLGQAAARPVAASEASSSAAGSGRA